VRQIKLEAQPGKILRQISASVGKMNRMSSKAAPKNKENRCEADFFVGLNMPFIGIGKPSELPFIRFLVPNTAFGTKRPHSGNGFTLIELIVTVAVVTILVSVAVPAFRTFVSNSRIATQTNDLRTDIALARSKVQGGLCSSTTGALCNGGGNWANGYMVWIDQNDNCIFDPGEQVRFRPPLAGGNTLTISVPAADPLSFCRPLAAPAGAALGGVTFSICDSRGAAYGRDMIINAVGQARSSGPPATLCP
jgi:type IV fimbrial biogenesis protein FimT